MAHATVATAVSIASPSGGWYGTEATAAKAKMWNSAPSCPVVVLMAPG
ncbi:MAG: hypothetical protein MOP51_885 [Citricoccus sp.]|jgi:hypothetical protein|nr:hypothetical protein [Citricoccus sp. WCRC_4]